MSPCALLVWDFTSCIPDREFNALDSFRDKIEDTAPEEQGCLSSSERNGYDLLVLVTGDREKEDNKGEDENSDEGSVWKRGTLEAGETV